MLNALLDCCLRDKALVPRMVISCIIDMVSSRLSRACGTSCRAPEQADADFGPLGSHTDIWGFATTILHLATGQLPYDRLSQLQMIAAMMKKRPPTMPESLPGWLQQLLKQCHSFDIAQRPSVAQLLQACSNQYCLGLNMRARARLVWIYRVILYDTTTLMLFVFIAYLLQT